MFLRDLTIIQIWSAGLALQNRWAVIQKNCLIDFKLVTDLK